MMAKSGFVGVEKIVQWAALLALWLIASGCGSNGQQVRIGVYRGEDLTPLTEALGHFAAEGLQVEVNELAGTSKAMEALFGGSVDVVAGGYDHAIRLATEGRAARSFMVMSVRSPLALVASPKTKRVRKVEDLKGSPVGVSAFGSSGNYFVEMLLSRHGLSRQDVQILATGGGHAVTVAWAEQGHVDAIVTLPASLSVLKSRHRDLVILANGTTAEGSKEVFGVESYPAICMMAKAEWLGLNGDKARALARAMRRTLDWIGDHSPEEFQTKLRGRSDSPEELEGLRAIIETRSRDGLMPEGGAEAIRDAVAVSVPAVRNVDVKSSFTNEFVPVK